MFRLIPPLAARGRLWLVAATATATLGPVAFATDPGTATSAPPEFAPAVEVASVPGTELGSLTELESGDMNGDGHADAVVTRIAYPLEQKTFPIGIFLSDGKGGFTNGDSLFEGPIPRTEHGRQIVIAEFNGDGRNDIFVADHGYDAMPVPGRQNTLVLSTPAGGLVDATANLPPATDFSHSATAADIDKDGDRDIYVGNLFGGDGSPPYLLLNDGTGHFVRAAGRLPAAQTDIDQNRYSRSLFLDANGDTSPDLLLGADTNSPESAVLLNDGTGHFSLVPTAMPPKAFGPTAITIAIGVLEANADGKLDLVLGFTKNVPFYTGHRLQILIGNGDGTFRDETAVRLPQPPSEALPWPVAIRVGDLDNDGSSDFAVDVRGIPEPVTFYLDDGTGVFRPHVPAAPRVGDFAFLDANDDGRLDIFSSLVGSPQYYERHFVHRQLTDDDSDGVEFAADNCPVDANSNQADVDKDRLGDACDSDDDGDAVADTADNCPAAANGDQANLDQDAQGDLCDADDDADGVRDVTDACPTFARAGFNGCPAGALTKVGRLALVRRTVQTGVRASCPAVGSGCTGRAVVRHRAKNIGSKKLALSAGKSAAVSLPLNARGRRLVGDRRKHKVTVTLQITGPDLRKMTLTSAGSIRQRGVRR